jgi:hypothetical protein
MAAQEPDRHAPDLDVMFGVTDSGSQDDLTIRVWMNVQADWWRDFLLEDLLRKGISDTGSHARSVAADRLRKLADRIELNG